MSWTELKVWRRLVVGPPRVEKQRLRVAYRVETADGHEERDLTFRWNADVLDPERDQGLAAMIGAQVALNYGLFCDELVVHGPLDEHDRRLLASMAHNTAREIYVNKLLKPNPLVSVNVPVHPRPEDLCATLVFPDAVAAGPSQPFGDGVAVLSSGGKDSLLTLGVCEELGLQPHSLFANESGRHWFTALNAWRHLVKTRPQHTARVWTDCDRLFTWAARRLPFVRADFDRVRADDYPIRLWTVAVFLFGVVPMMRARGLGTLLIGDEWDSTQRGTWRGIDHYEGYFDQSRFFDETLTRWFHAKGWNVVQCSLLRPLSELLIQDVLTARYPELASLQVSCHAASVVEEAARPCGRCEKCRRIVGMLVGLDRAPSQLGYSAEATTRCLAALAQRGSKQDTADARHLSWLLVQRGVMSSDAPAAVGARPEPGTVRLRIDPLRSPATAVPAELRAGSWRIFLQHAEGAWVRTADGWNAVDLMASDLPHRPHPFEPAVPPEERLAPKQAPWRVAELTWPQARRRLQEVDVALLPVGAIEQHGPHLPLDVDAWDAVYQCEQVAAACSDPKPLVLPGIPYGVSYHHGEFPGTLSVSPATLASMVHEVGLSAARQGVRKLLIVNGHGGNGPALHFAAQLINRDARILTLVDSGESSDAHLDALLETAGDAHAGELETSTSLATRPELVHMQHAETEVPRFGSPYLDFESPVAVGWYARTARYSASGVLGDPSRASAEKGRKAWSIIIDNMVELVEQLKATPLESMLPKGP